MSIEEERRIDLQTRRLPRIAPGSFSPGLSGVQTLDLSTADPEPAPFFALAGRKGAVFQKKKRDPDDSSAWGLGEPDSSLEFDLTLPVRHGVVLILEMRRTTVGEHADNPLTINVNGHEMRVDVDPHNLHFSRQSWYLPNYLLEKGKNQISLSLAPDAQTELRLKSAAVMRFDLQRQLQTKWCWAAVTTSLLNFFNPDNTPTQCQVVQQCLSLNHDFDPEATDCCQQGSSKACNLTYKLPDALDEMELLFSRCNYPLSLDEIRGQIQAGVPVAVRIKWRGGGGHFVVITAVFDDPDGDEQTWLRIADPLDQAASYITYRTLKNRYKGEGRWTHSYVFQKERERRR
ncbi:MAG TPA: papain-like cysteine protease family protein [Blastocatellia bacterium]|nr:papain-like cysteine protease family protein [Blastocatellia bacterium]